MRPIFAISAIVVAAIGIGAYVYTQQRDEETKRSLLERRDVREYIDAQTRNGYRVELKGDTLTIWDCAGKKKAWFADRPGGIRIECVDGFKGTIWTLDKK